MQQTSRSRSSSSAVPEILSPGDPRIPARRAHRLGLAPDADPVFAPLANYLGTGDPLRRYQLARRIADLYDQYQVHRPDWLERWAAGDDLETDEVQKDVNYIGNQVLSKYEVPKEAIDYAMSRSPFRIV